MLKNLDCHGTTSPPWPRSPPWISTPGSYSPARLLRITRKSSPSQHDPPIVNVLCSAHRRGSNLSIKLRRDAAGAHPVNNLYRPLPTTTDPYQHTNTSAARLEMATANELIAEYSEDDNIRPPPYPGRYEPYEMLIPAVQNPPGMPSEFIRSFHPALYLKTESLSSSSARTGRRYQFPRHTTPAPNSCPSDPLYQPHAWVRRWRLPQYRLFVGQDMYLQ